MPWAIQPDQMLRQAIYFGPICHSFNIFVSMRQTWEVMGKRSMQYSCFRPVQMIQTELLLVSMSSMCPQVHEASHQVMQEKPEEVNGALLHFIEGVTA